MVYLILLMSLKAQMLQGHTSYHTRWQLASGVQLSDLLEELPRSHVPSCIALHILRLFVFCSKA